MRQDIVRRRNDKFKIRQHVRAIFFRQIVSFLKKFQHIHVSMKSVWQRISMQFNLSFVHLDATECIEYQLYSAVCNTNQKEEIFFWDWSKIEDFCVCMKRTIQH